MNEHLKATLGLDNGPFARGLRGAKGMAASFSDSVKGLLGKDLLRGIQAAFAFGALQKVFGFADGLATLRDSTGASIKMLQSWREAAVQTGSTAQQADKAINKLAIGIGEAVNGSGEAKTAFEKLGISLVDNEGYIKSTDKVLTELADAFKNTKSQAEKSAIAKKLFGDENAKLAVTLSGGSDALVKFGEALENTGRLLSDEEINQLDKYDKALKRIQDNAFIGGTKLVGFMGRSIETAAQFWGAATASGLNSNGVTADLIAAMQTINELDEQQTKAAKAQLEVAQEKVKAQQSLVDLKKEQADAEKRMDEAEADRIKRNNMARFQNVEEIIKAGEAGKMVTKQQKLEVEQAKLALYYAEQAEKFRGISPEISRRLTFRAEIVRGRIGSLTGEQKPLGEFETKPSVPVPYQNPYSLLRPLGMDQAIVDARGKLTPEMLEATKIQAQKLKDISAILENGIVVIPKNGP